MSNAAVKTRYRSERYGHSGGMWSTSSFETPDKAISHCSTAQAGRVYDEFTRLVIFNKDYNQDNVPDLFLKLYETDLYKEYYEETKEAPQLDGEPLVAKRAVSS